MLNFHIISILCPVFVALVLALQIFYHIVYSPDLSKKILAWLIVTFFVFCSTVVIYQSGNFLLFRYFDSVYMSSMLLLHPLFYIYIKALVYNKLSGKEFVHFVAPVSIFLTSGFLYLLLDKGQTLDYLGKYMLGEPSEIFKIELLYKVYELEKLIHLLQAVLYFGLIIKLLKVNRLSVEELFSSTAKYRLNWLFTFNIFYSSVTIAGVAINFIPMSTLNTTSIYLDFTMLIMGFFILYIGTKGLKQQSIGLIIEHNDIASNVEAVPDLKDDILLEKINSYVVGERAFLIPDLKIWDIVKQTGINRSYISQVINKKHGMSFSNYINQMRVGEVCDKITNRPDINIETIAFDSGFNSLATFNRAFKLFVKMSPTEYRKRNGVSSA